MATAAVIATQLTDRSARTYTLTVGGRDVTRYVDIESIDVDEQGPGSISSMSFTVVDPSSEVGHPQEGDEVEFWDNDNDRPLFAGWVQSWRIETYGLGRTITVECIGVEVLLDWIVTRTVAIDTLATGLHVAIQTLASGFGLNITRTNGVLDGNQSSPVGDLDEWAMTDHYGGAATVTIEGQRLRDALMEASFATVWDNTPDGATSVRPYFTVDFYRGLRAWRGPNVGPQVVVDEQIPADYANLTVTDTVVGTTAATTLSHQVDAAGRPHTVHVTGGSAAGSGLVGDGTGLQWPRTSLSEPDATTVDDRDTAGRGYLLKYGPSTTGTLTLENYNPTTNVRAGSMLILTDAPTGATGTYRITSIRKRFRKSGGAIRQDWTVSYGGPPPSAMRQIRNLTSSSTP